MKLHLFSTVHYNFVNEVAMLSQHYSHEKRNVSKSYTKGAMALCISTTSAIGIDLEKKVHRAPETIEHFVKKFSTFSIKDIPADMDNQWFYKAWTAMESYFKLAGAGFGTPKDFVLDISRQSIWRDTREIAWFEYFHMDDLIICVCSDNKFCKQDIELTYHGWEDYK